MKLNAAQLRTREPDPETLRKIKKNPIYIVLDNVYDTYNIGAIFRLADAVAAEKIYLCGQTETPPNPRIKKASINTWKWVEWEYVETAVSAISKIKNSRLSGISRLNRGFSTSSEHDAEMRNNLQTASGQNSQPKADRPLAEKINIIAIEQHKKSIPLSKFKPEFPLVIVVGNETYGVSKEVLKIADKIVELPMFGINTSLNVMVSLGIVLYKIMEYL